MKWVLNRVDSKKMDLPGLAQDRRNLWESVPKIFPSIRVTLVEKTFYQDMVCTCLVTATAFLNGHLTGETSG